MGENAEGVTPPVSLSHRIVSS